MRSTPSVGDQNFILIWVFILLPCVMYRFESCSGGLSLDSKECVSSRAGHQSRALHIKIQDDNSIKFVTSCWDIHLVWSKLSKEWLQMSQFNTDPIFNLEKLILSPGLIYRHPTQPREAIYPSYTSYKNIAPLETSLLGWKPMFWGPCSCHTEELPWEPLNGQPRVRTDPNTCS